MLGRLLVVSGSGEAVRGLTWRPSGPQPLATGRGAPSFGTATSIPGHTGRSVLLEKGRDGFKSEKGDAPCCEDRNENELN